jgi:hypothetical protein
MKIVTQLTLNVAMAGLLAFASGCKTGPVQKQGFDFRQYHTFAIRPLPTTGTPRDPTLAARLGPTARQAVQDTLSAKGFKEVPQSQADFHVNLLFDYAPVPEDEKGRQERHMLEIDIVDSKSNEVVWSDWRHRTTDRTISAEGAQKLVAEMLKPFPPGAKSTGTGG